MSGTEYFEILNEDGSLTGILKERSLVHRDGDLHGASHIWVICREGEKLWILLQKRSEEKDSYPGCFDVSAAGHLDPGESFLDGALRELGEELGLNAKPAKLIYFQQKKIDQLECFHGTQFHNRELISSFIYEMKEKKENFCFQREEISEVLWTEAGELGKRLTDGSMKHCIDETEYAHLCTLILPKSVASFTAM